MNMPNAYLTKRLGINGQDGHHFHLFSEKSGKILVRIEKSKKNIPVPLYIYLAEISQGRIFIISLGVGGVWTNHGGCIFP